MFTSLTQNFCEQLKIKRPIIQAPMAGGIITPELIAEVIKAQSLGSLPLGYLSVEEAQALIQKTKTLTSHFAVNIFVPSAYRTPQQPKILKMLQHINRYRLKLGLTELSTIPPFQESTIDAFIDMIIQEDLAILSFTFGILNPNIMKRLKHKGVYIMGTATTVAEGLALEEAGCDAIIAQGYEAGGHRGGGFLNNHPQGLIGTMALIPLLVDALKMPIIATGGIMDGRGIAAALMLGASGVQMGTAFINCLESKASAGYKQAILQARAEETCITTAFTGKTVRGLKNEFIAATEQSFGHEEILPYPLQHQLTKELRVKANQVHDVNYSGLWCGQGSNMARALSVQDLINTLEQETWMALKNIRQI